MQLCGWVSQGQRRDEGDRGCGVAPSPAKSETSEASRTVHNGHVLDPSGQKWRPFPPTVGQGRPGPATIQGLLTLGPLGFGAHGGTHGSLRAWREQNSSLNYIQPSLLPYAAYGGGLEVKESTETETNRPSLSLALSRWRPANVYADCPELILPGCNRIVAPPCRRSMQNGWFTRSPTKLAATS